MKLTVRMFAENGLAADNVIELFFNDFRLAGFFLCKRGGVFRNSLFTDGDGAVKAGAENRNNFFFWRPRLCSCGTDQGAG